MGKIRFIIFIIAINIILAFCGVGLVWAGNNKVGIHILETVEVEKASKLVNSSGGDWGYVTIVLRDDDMDKGKWQKFMDDCRRLHLVPIVRIATHPLELGWAKPEGLEKWVDLLDSLNWPVKKQMVIIFNEPNHAKEWGGEVNPGEYAEVLEEMIGMFKEKNEDFFVMGAGLDQQADGNNGTMREVEFLNGMVGVVPEIFDMVNGWSSHSYPRGFSGSVEGVGRASIRGYKWELEQVEKELPVYITETGWGYGSEEKKAENMVRAFSIWEGDERVEAVTPFVLNYPAAPFEKFSWFGADGEPSGVYEKVLGVSKIAGDVEQVESYEVVDFRLAEILPTEYEAKGKIRLKNTGQWIMGEKNCEFRIANLELGIESLRLNSLVYPGEEIELEFEVKTGTESAEHKLVLGDKTHNLYVFKPFDLKHPKVSLWRQIVTKMRLWLER